MTYSVLYKNTKISYSVYSNGAAVVLLHGFLENQTMWDYYIADLSKTHQIITIDLLGHGDSECLGYIHSMTTQAEMVYAVLQNLNVSSAVFIGHSMGGYVALAFADSYKDFITGLALLNSTALEDNHERKINRNRAIKMAHNQYVALVTISISNLFSEINRVKMVSEIEITKQEALKTPLQGYIAAQEGMKIRKNTVSILQKTSFKKLLILGKKDGVLNFDENKKQIANTNVQLIGLDGGHMSHIENKDELKKVLLNFIKL